VSVRSVLRRSRTLRSVWYRARPIRFAAGERLSRLVAFDKLPPAAAVRVAFEVMLGREPDGQGLAQYVEAITTGRLTRRQMVQALRGSEEFSVDVRFSGAMFGHSIHSGRCQFVRSLPRASRILDLGGTHLYRDIGALVALGYPYPFEELVVVDLPTDERHVLYRASEWQHEVVSPLGPVRYRYHSMSDLSGLADEQFDLVYSGQSFEHVTPQDGKAVLAEVHRVLRPGGYLAMDTPNARVTRLQQEAFIDPDHKVEYRLVELVELVEAAGFVVRDTKGLNYAGPCVAAGRFDVDVVAGNSGMYDEAEDCYILCLVCRKAV
jgi:predicted SAM-dependent methyltransferase